jgi:hypothetical protein
MARRRKTDFAPLRTAIVAGCHEFLTALANDWTGEKLYGFLLEAAPEGDNVQAVAGTEEGLTRIAEHYATNLGYRARKGKTLPLLRTLLRWGSPRDGWYVRFDAIFFDEANRLLQEACEQGAIEPFDGKLNGLCLEALRELDDAGVFGTGEERDRVLIGICYVGGDNSEQEFFGWAEKVNPPPVIERVRSEREQGFKASRRVERDS